MTRAELIAALKSAKGPESKPCLECGSLFYRVESGPMSWPHRWNNRRFCSVACGGIWANKSKMKSAEEMRRMILALPTNESGCLLWQGATSGGYPTISWNRETFKGHRLSFELFFGRIPTGLFVWELYR